MTAQFVIIYLDQYYRFHFEGEHQNKIVFSRLFRSLALCKKGINELVESVKYPERLHLALDEDGVYTFTIHNAEDVIIVHSGTFYAVSTLGYAIRQLKTQTSTASVIENTTPKRLNILH